MLIGTPMLLDTKSKKFFISLGTTPLGMSISDEDHPGKVLYTGLHFAR